MTSTMSSSVEGELIWSSFNYSMRDFVEAFGHSLPVVVKTTAGYAGYDEGMHQIGSGEVYLVCDIQRQKRLVVQPEKSDFYLSIPTEYPVKVQILQEGSKKVGPPVPVSDVLDVLSKTSSQVRLMFEKNQPVSFQIGADLGSTAKLGVLTVLQTYEEKYLLANTIFGRSIFPHAQGIPVYLPIDFVTASELRVGGSKALSLWLKDVMEVMKNHKQQPVRMCQELILFSERPSSGEYEYIKLADFSNFKEKDKIYSAAIFKRQNPYDLDPEKPKLPGHRSKEQAQTAPLNRNQSIALPRFPPPDPNSVQPSPAGGTTSAPSQRSIQPGPAGGTTPTPSQSPLQPGPAGGTTSTKPSRPAFTAKGSARPAPPIPGEGSSLSSPVRSPTSPGGRPSPLLPKSKSKSAEELDQDAYEELGPVSPPSGGIYESLSEVPTHEEFEKLTIEQVVGCLRLLRLGHHAEKFRTRHIDGRMALCLTEEMLVKEFDFRSFDAIQFMMFAKEGWRPK